MTEFYNFLFWSAVLGVVGYLVSRLWARGPPETIRLETPRNPGHEAPNSKR